MSHDVFISYASPDKPMADAAVASLEAHGIRCWVAPRDVLPGQSYMDAISAAVTEARLVVLVFSAATEGSRHVEREVELALSRGTAIVPLRVEDVAPAGSLRYALAGTHWLDALSEPLDAHLQRLSEAVGTLLQLTPVGATTTGNSDSPDHGRTIPASQNPASEIRAMDEPQGQVPGSWPPATYTAPQRRSVPFAVWTWAWWLIPAIVGLGLFTMIPFGIAAAIRRTPFFIWSTVIAIGAMGALVAATQVLPSDSLLVGTVVFAYWLGGIAWTSVGAVRFLRSSPLWRHPQAAQFASMQGATGDGQLTAAPQT